MNPQVDRSKPEAEQAAGQISLHKIDETDDAIVVSGARMLATLAPFADELLIYPGSDIRPQDGRYALSFAIPIATPGLKLICRDSYSKQRPAFDYPLVRASTRWTASSSSTTSRCRRSASSWTATRSATPR